MRHGKRNIISWLFILVLLIPATVSVQHHHESPGKHAETNNSETSFSHKCLICDLLFSTISISQAAETFSITPCPDNYILPGTQFNFSATTEYSFLLRAPPVFRYI